MFQHRSGDWCDSAVGPHHCLRGDHHRCHRGELQGVPSRTSPEQQMMKGAWKVIFLDETFMLK